jgi:hypothetical protein
MYNNQREIGINENGKELDADLKNVVLIFPKPSKLTPIISATISAFLSPSSSKSAFLETVLIRLVTNRTRLRNLRTSAAI